MNIIYISTQNVKICIPGVSCEPCYKIVQTKENGKKKLCAVPSAWEQNGILRWPLVDSNTSAVAAKKLLSNINSVPGADWISLKCKLKRRHPTKAAAETEIDSMMPNSDTSSNESDASKMPPPLSHPNGSVRPPKRKAALVSFQNADDDRNNFSEVVRRQAKFFRCSLSAFKY